MMKTTAWAAGFAMMGIMAALVVTGSPGVRAYAQSAAAHADVTIDNFRFGPETMTVPVGASVTWTNRDDIPHTVVGTNGEFKSKVRDTDEQFSVTFTRAGTYQYYCSLHPKMTGKIVVQ